MSYLTFTLSYLMGETFYCIALRPVVGPMLIPDLTVISFNWKASHNKFWTIWILL